MVLGAGVGPAQALGSLVFETNAYTIPPPERLNNYNLLRVIKWLNAGVSRESGNKWGVVDGLHVCVVAEV